MTFDPWDMLIVLWWAFALLALVRFWRGES